MPSTVIRKTVNSVGANQLATIVVVLLLWLASPLKTFRHPDAPAVARRHHKAFSDVVTLHEQLVQDLAAGTRESLEKGLTNAYKAALAMRVPRKSYVEEDVDIGHGTKTLGIRSGNSSWSHVQSSLIGSKENDESSRDHGRTEAKDADVCPYLKPATNNVCTHTSNSMLNALLTSADRSSRPGVCAHEVNVSTSAGGGEGDHGRPQVDEDAGFRSADAVAGTADLASHTKPAPRLNGHLMDRGLSARTGRVKTQAVRQRRQSDERLGREEPIHQLLKAEEDGVDELDDFDVAGIRLLSSTDDLDQNESDGR
jgi:hypothetical protein